MSLLAKAKPRPARLQAVREVHVEAPLERLDDMLSFYSAVLDVQPWPADQQLPGAWGGGKTGCGLLLVFRHGPPPDPVRRRFTLLVASLDEVSRRLEERQWPFRRMRGFFWTDQYIQLNDPAGIAIELRQSSLL